MISVEFKSVRAGTCQWCRKEKDEVFDVAFSDKSLVGQMCRADLFRAIGMKLPAQPKPVPAAQPAGNSVGVK
jgi:hypothetical protein